MLPRRKKWLLLSIALLLLAVLSSWFRSHLYADQIGWTAESFALFVDLDSGLVRLTLSSDANTVGRMRFLAGSGFIYSRNSPSVFAGEFTTWRNLGFGYQRDDGTGHQV